MPKNKTLQTRFRARIELTFDFRNHMMEQITVFSKVILIGLIVLVVIQLIILLYKDVGLLTFWTLFEYS